MANRQQTKFRIAQRREHVALYYLKGWTQAEIAEQLGVSRSTVGRDVKAVREAWLEAAVRDFDQARGQEIAKFDLVEREAWQAWERSKQDAVTKKVHQEKISGTSKKRAEQVTRKQIGDPRYLQMVVNCILQRCRLLHLLDREQGTAAADGEAYIDLAVIRTELLHEPSYLEYRRREALASDMHAGDVRPPGEPGSLADGGPPDDA